MANDEFNIPLGKNNKKRRSSELLPKYFRTVANQKFLSSTLDQLTQPGVVEKIDGYFGRKNSKAYNQSSDNYVGDVSSDRENYQFEPAVVIEDDLDNVNYFADYNDYINSIKVRQGIVDDHSRLNSQEYYAWNPHINWDKFTNFREYYWLPNGPDSIDVIGEPRDLVTTISVTKVDNGDNIAYAFDDDTPTPNPTLTLYRGQTYTFVLNTDDMPFTIRTTSRISDDNLYNNGLSQQKVEQGTITFEVPLDAPSYLYYINDLDIEASGLIKVLNIEENSEINVEEEILGKKTYRMNNGYDLSNGMKIRFGGIVTPEKYATGEWFVEGVGKSIKLVEADNLEITANYLSDINTEFDTNPFDKLPFDDALSYANTKDYIIINRASPDANQWARYNKWFHKDVIEKTAEILSIAPEINQDNRAKRPIIEFDAGLKLINSGTQVKKDIDVYDNFTKDALSIVEGSLGYSVDGISLVEGMRVIFGADTDARVKGKIYRVTQLQFNNNTQIALKEEEDADPLLNETVLVKTGNNFKGKILYYNGTDWKVAQEKTKTNQSPLFDIFDSNGNSISSYESSTFTGTKIFSYREGTGTADSELGFPLSYKSIENSGDIIFDFNLLADTFNYQDSSNVITRKIDNLFLKDYQNRETSTDLTAWTKAEKNSIQKVVRQYDTEDQNNDYAIDVYNKSGTLNDLVIEVFVDNKKLKQDTDYTVYNVNDIRYINFSNNLSINNKLVIKTQSSAKKNANGFYEFPINLQNNPLNENIESFTFGQVIDHVESIVENLDEFEGTFPGTSNLRNLGPISQFGTKFVQHSGSINIASYHLTNRDSDALKAIRFGKNEYGKFKRAFLQTANDLGYDGETQEHVNLVLQTMMKNKTKDDPFYFSDMVPFEGFLRYDYIVYDDSDKFFSFGEPFDNTVLSNRAISVYKNNVQLILGTDYTLTDQGFVEIKNVAVDDNISVFDYTTTDGCWVPPTPTKLGLYPKYVPEVQLDDTYILSEPETTGPFKIYGVKSPDMNEGSKLGWFYPLYTTEVDAQQKDTLNGGTGTAKVLMFAGSNTVFYLPTTGATESGNYTEDFVNYPKLVCMIQGHDGSKIKAYGDFRDNLLLELEKRIYNNIKQEYNKDIFNIEDFVGSYTNRSNFDRFDITKSLIVDFNQWLDLAGNVGYTTNSTYTIGNGFTYNYSHGQYPDDSNLPGSWRAVYNEYLGTDRPHTHPWECLGFTIKPDYWDNEYGTAPYTSDNLVLWKDIQDGIVAKPKKTITKYKHPDLLKYIPVDNDGNLVPPNLTGLAKSLITPQLGNSFRFGDESPVETAWRKSSDFPFALICAWLINQPAKVFSLAFDISRIKRDSSNNLVYTETGKRMNSKDLLFPNGADDDNRINTAGIVNYMQALLLGNSEEAYTRYKNDLINLDNKMAMKIAGFTQKEKFRLILDSRTPTNEGNLFVPEENYKIFLNTSAPLDLYSYSGVIIEKSASGYSLRGYDRTSPVFKYYAPVHQQNDPAFRVGGISQSFVDWDSQKTYEQDQIVRYEDTFFRVTLTHTSGNTFNQDNFAKLPFLPEDGGVTATLAKIFESTVSELSYGTTLRTVQEVVDFLLGYGTYLSAQGFVFDNFNESITTIEDWKLSAKEFMFWTLQNWKAGTLLTVSPSANVIKFEKEYAVVDDVFDNFFDYSLLSADGQKFLPEFTSTERDNSNQFGLQTVNTADGIYHIKIPVVQKEHVVILDNSTVFNDTIYDKASGYRQERIKVLGYRSDDWNGGLNIPGFIYDNAKVTEWLPWQDYAIGDLVKYKQFYYTARSKILGSAQFQTNNWLVLSSKPESGLLPNWDYKANQFSDFYDLETDNFDTDQQKLAQHLIGYQTRKYLENIIPDPVSQYKFYQGFIRDKATKNSLTKLFDKLGSANKESLEFFEEWAIRSGQYGANAGFDEFEIKLDESKYRLSPQTIELVDTIDPRDTSLVYKLRSNDIYVKPNNYNHKPFPTKYFAEGYSKTAGYVNIEDVKFQVLDYNEIANLSINEVATGDYVWVGREKQSWNVYKHVGTNNRITAMSQSGTSSEITLDTIPSVKTGDIVGIVNTENDGFYVVESVKQNKVTITGKVTEESDIDGFLTVFESARINELADLNQFVAKTNLFENETVWVDDAGDGKWSVLKNSKAYNIDKEIFASEPNTTIGKSFDVDKNTVTLVAGGSDSAGTGRLEIYLRASEVEDYRLNQTFNEQTSLFSSNSKFGDSVAVSDDGQYIVVGAPDASNVKTQFKDLFAFGNTYEQGDIVSYKEQLWRARRQILPAETTVFNTFNSSALNLVPLEDENGSYPSIPFMIRGNYSFPEEATNHILIKAPASQYEATKIGDKLQLKWNEFTTRYPEGSLPFGNDLVITKDFINGEHPIVEKIDLIVLIDNTQAIPGVGDIVQTTAGKAEVYYRFTNQDNRTIIYLKDVNGDFGDTDELYSGVAFLGEYTKVFPTEYSAYNGWWLINVGTSFNSQNITETNEGLIIKDIIKSDEVDTVNNYFNIFDNLQNATATQNTEISYIETLSFIEGQTEIVNLSTKWVFREPREANFVTGQQFNFNLNKLKLNNQLQSPEAIGLTFDYLNNTTHTVNDIWDGEIEVLFTNFDLQGNPFIPQVGDIVLDQNTNASAEVANVIRLFDRVRLFVKNTTANWSLGLENNDLSTLSFFLNDSTERLVGNIVNTKLDTTTVGRLVVVDKGQDIPISPSNILTGLEYWIYENDVKQGITRTVEAPDQFNFDWQQTNHIPVIETGNSSSYTKEGVIGVYRKSSGQDYNLEGYFSIPTANTNRKLGTKVKIIRDGTNYTIIAHAAGDGTELNEGRLYFFYKTNSDNVFQLGKDPYYRGIFDSNLDYFENEIVLYNNSLYKAITNLTAQSFNNMFWTELSESTDVQGFIPNISGITLGDDSAIEQNLLTNFGEKFAISGNGEVLITTASYINLDDSSQPNVKVAVYRKTFGRYQYSQLIESQLNDYEAFGSSLDISTDGTQIFIGAPSNSVEANDSGTVYVYTQTNGTFQLTQTIRSIDKEINTQFGTNLSFDNNVLAVSSRGGDIKNKTSFDTYRERLTNPKQGEEYVLDPASGSNPASTVWDNDLTSFSTTDSESGTVSVFELINNTLVYAQNFSLNRDVLYFGDNIKTKNNHVYVSLPGYDDPDDAIIASGLIVDYKKDKNARNWNTLRTPIDQVNLDKFNGAFLYNTKTQKLITYLDYIDPIQGKIAGPAEQEISFKTSYDPATYSSVSEGTNATYDQYNFTNEKFVGKLWWNIGNAKWINPYQGDIITSVNKFNELFPGTTVDVYEWVKTERTPSQWDDLADTEQGLAKGISGKSLYGNGAFSSTRTYDSATGTFTTYNYFWVQNKKTVPDIYGRSVSAYEVQQFIQNPSQQGYKFITLLANNKLALYNCESLIEDTDVALNIRYWTIDNQDINIHNEYQILTEGLPTSKPNADIERKWIDSLVGYDIESRPVPDPNLSAKQKYGIQNIPRQSMFVNRVEAVKQLVERVNIVLKDKLIVDEYDITNLNLITPKPSVNDNTFDKIIDSFAELRTVNTSNARQAKLNLIIVDGRIAEVQVQDQGQGYITPPIIEIIDSQGEAGELIAEINESGSIIDINIRNVGKNYSSNVQAIVRPFSVLINSDESIGGRWAVYQYINGEFNRSTSQAFDVTRYWNYIDWYQSGYNINTAINFVVQGAYELDSLNDAIGNIIKINNVGTGGWLLLRKINDVPGADYTVNYETVGRQNGTIAFNKLIYDSISSNTGYDGISYDSAFFDLQAVDELRIILQTIKENIFIGDLETEYNNLFFASLRYAFSEQPYIDWAFKTSFVKAKHNVGNLEQKITFNNDSLPSYEEYIKEAKPYASKIREYVSIYENLENSQSSVTDFDAPPVYNERQGKILPQELTVRGDSVITGDTETDFYPSKHYIENLGFEIKEIVLGDQGTRYSSAPVVEITGGGGSGAKATAYLGSGGKISNIVVTNGGSGYITAPLIVLNGSLEDGGREAKATAILGNGKIRSAHLICKFDRTTGTMLLASLDTVETFVSKPNQQIFDLKYPLNLDTTTVTITVNGIESLRSTYSLQNVTDEVKGYTRNKGQIIFTTAPVANSEIIIDYKKDITLLQAQDRINLFYNPTTGMLANDLSQLLDGIDYGGVEIDSIDFGGGAGWDSDRWFTSSYDVFDTTYEDEVFRVTDDSTKIYTFAKPLETNVSYNVYKNGIRIDDPNFGTPQQTNDTAIISSIIGSGQTGFTFVDDQNLDNIIGFDEETLSVSENDVFIIRKTTSDGSFVADPASYDTLLQGGNLSYTTASGVKAEDIVVDGDGFVTPTTSKGPEELVPGQVLDTVDIKVYHRSGRGGSTISSNTYRGDGITKTFAFGVLPQNADSLFVKIDSTLQDKTQYTVDYKNREITFTSIPEINQLVNIVSLSGNGEKILDLDIFVGDGSTNTFVTRVSEQDEVNYYATVDGVVVESIIEAVDGRYNIIFGEAPADGSIINYAIYEGEEQTFSEIKIDTFDGDGSTGTFQLSLTPFSRAPSIQNIIVKVDNTILSSGYKESFDITTAREYQMREWQQEPGKLSSEDIRVYLNETRELISAQDYIIRPFNSSIELFEGVGGPGDKLEIYVTVDSEYSLTNITELDSSYTNITLKTIPADGQRIEVYHFSKHDIQKIEKQHFDVINRVALTVGTDEHEEYHRLRNGIITLPAIPVDINYVWVTKNKILLTPSIDYKLTDNKKAIKLKDILLDNDAIEIIQFGTEGVSGTKFAFRQFKDVLNRTVYKRLGDSYEYKLAQDLHIFDKEIVLESVEGLATPNPQNNLPGVLMINGERIEFFKISGNKLSQITRGTLGTGVATVHETGSDVFNQGFQQTVPYKDETVTLTFDGDGSTTQFDLGYTPRSNNEFDVFVGGRRLRKNAISKFNILINQDSPEADETSPAEFTVDGITSLVTLAEAPDIGEKVIVTRKIGRLWAPDGSSLETTNNLITRFLKAEQASLPE